MKDFGADKRLSQLHGKHCVSAVITRMGEVKNNPQGEAECRSLRWCLLQEAPDLLWASCSSSPPASPGRDPQSWALTSTLQVRAGPGTTERCRSTLTVTHGLPLLIFTHCLNKLIQACAGQSLESKDWHKRGTEIYFGSARTAGPEKSNCCAGSTLLFAFEKWENRKRENWLTSRYTGDSGNCDHGAFTLMAVQTSEDIGQSKLCFNSSWRI